MPSRYDGHRSPSDAVTYPIRKETYLRCCQNLQPAHAFVESISVNAFTVVLQPSKIKEKARIIFSLHKKGPEIVYGCRAGLESYTSAHYNDLNTYIRTYICVCVCLFVC